MKTGILTTKTIASDDIKDNKSIMGMSAKGMELAQYFLRDRIYSDKVLAVVREYISNAQDEHTKYGIEKGVYVSIKSDSGQWMWSVRDYAMGLNDHDIRNIFGVYFESTKSNENNSIGGFGIGGKAGFSYTDTFYVTSYHNGTKTSYICTLGAGTKGIPVGEIYEISQEPTTESGIEISLEIKSGDLTDFSDTTSLFVKFFQPDSNIVFDNEYSNTMMCSHQPLNTVEVDGYKFNSYAERPYDDYNHHYTYYVRMGGVVYPHKTTTQRRRMFSDYVIVDVPIGKLSIPISRESIENTPLNDRVFKEIEDALDKIETEEILGLTVPKFGSIITGNTPFGNIYKGVWFNHDFKSCFPTTHKYYYNTGRIWDSPSPTSSVVNKNATKYVVYIMPNIESLKNWHKRLINSLQKIKGDDYCGYVWICKNHYEKLLEESDKFIDITDCSFLDVKKLKLPALDKKVSSDKEEYIIYDRYGRKNYYTAQGLDDEVRKTSFDDEELEDDWHLEVENMDILHQRTIASTKDYGTRSSFRTANSKKMIENLKELGWLTPDSKEYKDIKAKFDEIYRIERLVRNATQNLERLFYGIKPKDRLKIAIKNNPDKIKKFEAVKAAILSEDTTRSRILKSMESYGYGYRINRQDLRKILAMKD